MLKRAVAERLQPVSWFHLCCYAWAVSLIFSTLLAEFFALMLIALWFGNRRRHGMPWDWLSILLLVFFGIRILSILTSVAPEVSVEALRKIPFMLVFFPLAGFSFQHGTESVQRIIRCLALAGLTASVMALLAWWLKGPHRLHSTTSGPLTLATYLSAVLVICAAIALHPGRRPGVRFYFGGFVMLLAMSFTYTRAPWVISMAALAPLCRKKTTLMTSVLSLGMLSFLLTPNFYRRFLVLLNWPVDVGDRKVIWLCGWELAAKAPVLGFGPNTFALLFDRRDLLMDQGAGTWHNAVLQLWIESGWPSVLVFLLLSFVLVRMYLRHRSGDQERVLKALLAGLAVIWVNGLFGGLMADPIIDMLFWGLMGLFAGLINRTTFLLQAHHETIRSAYTASASASHAGGFLHRALFVSRGGGAPGAERVPGAHSG